MGSLNDDDFESAKELSDEDIILEIERVYFLIFWFIIPPKIFLGITLKMK